MNRVGITGFGVVSPIGTGREAFWDALLTGVSGIGAITRFDASGFEVRLAGEVKDTPELPAEISRAAGYDPKIGFAFSACEQALRQAGISELGDDSILTLGTGLEIFDLQKIMSEGLLDLAAAARNSLSPDSPPLQFPLDNAVRLIGDYFGNPGRCLTNVSACAASTQAIGQGFREIRSGRCRVAVCGGFDSMINPLGMGGFQLLRALSIRNEFGSRACRPFDSERGGAVLGEGAACVVLESMEQIQAEGRECLAEVCGYGSSLDAYNLSAPSPEGEGAMRAIQAALQDAGISPEAIGHINTHGTGTRLNDATEAGAIRRVFESTWEDIPVSATKSVTGHLIGAAGAVEAGACLLALVRGRIPFNPSLKEVGTGCELNHVRDNAADFEGEYVLKNSFGFGGQNASLIFKRTG